ncbi:fumarate hydratase class II [Comamonadaceae bacterium OS-4]|nr:fumarate hydratase class II [Comamonadaceae bacterium OS-4]
MDLPIFRKERDSMGIVDVPAGALWGATTQRSLTFFAISTERMPRELLAALAHIKKVCAQVNCELGLLNPAMAAAIAQAADEVLAGAHWEDFPLSIWQTGSGTQTNMNMNEVLANRASEILGEPRGLNRTVHPNDHVNLGHSTNDIFPTAMHLAAVQGVSQKLLPSLNQLRSTLHHQAQQYARLIKLGRTHLQDATPITFGQEISGWAAQLDHAKACLEQSLVPLMELAVGGTAVGTGLNTHPEFGSRVAARLSAECDFPLRCAQNRFAAIAAHDALVSAHGTLKTLAVALMKIANDVRWLASGPRAGLGEIHLPENEPGSSIMPGKVNPTQCEALTMVCCQVIGNDVALGLGGAMGNFELNAFKPLIAYNFMQSVRFLSDAMHSFDTHCMQGMVADADRMTSLLERSLMLVTALTPHIGYDRAAAIAKAAQARGTSLREEALASNALTAAEFDAWVQYPKMV